MQHRRSCQNFCSIHVYVLPTAAEYVQHHVRFVNVQSSLPENVVFSVCAHMGNAAYIIFIMWNSISGLDAWYHFRFNVIYAVAVTVRSHQIKFQFILFSAMVSSKRSKTFLVETEDDVMTHDYESNPYFDITKENLGEDYQGTWGKQLGRLGRRRK